MTEITSTTKLTHSFDNNMIMAVMMFCLSAGMTVNTTASAGLVPDGDYNLAIMPTPFIQFGDISFPDYGNETRGWNSSFTFGGLPRAGDTRLMSDNDILIGWDGGRGTSVAGDGYAGVLGMTITGNNIAITSFQVDTTPSTAGGPFAQYADPTTFGGAQTTNLENMVGTIDDVGNMSLTLDGRLGAIAGFPLFDKRWNYDDTLLLGGATWAPLTTETSTNRSGSVVGRPLTNIGDVNGDLIDDYSLTLLSASHVGGDWGGFKTTPYTEVWKSQLLSVIPPLVANTVAGPQTLNVSSNGNGFSVAISLQDTDGSTAPVTAVEAGVMIVSVGAVMIPEGVITEHVTHREISGDTLTVFFDDPATGNRQDIIAAVSNLIDGSLVDVCVEGSATDGNGLLRPFAGCDAITIKNKGSR